MDWTTVSLADAAAALASRRVSSIALVEAHLDRINRYDPRLNTFITLTAEAALIAARTADSEIAAGRYRGPLHGIPIALKDLFDTAGVRTTAGSRFFADYIPTADAFVVERLKQAGAIMLGKLNLHEIALGVINNNPHFGPCSNPWDVDRIPGGSSGGSASALAAGLCLGALGSDTRGSIRIPAALCGIVGLKPTRGRVSLRGVFPLSWSLDHTGPLARSVQDVATLFQMIAAHDPADPCSIDTPTGNDLGEPDQGMRVMRIGVARDSFFTAASADIMAAVEDAITVFASLGASIIEVDAGFAEDSRQSSRVIVSSDAAAFHFDRLKFHPEDFGPDVLLRLREGLAFTAAEYALARRAQTTLTHRLLTLYAQHDLDILLTPTVPMVAPRLDDSAGIDTARATLSYFTAPFNMTGFPALSLPCGFSSEGLPIGLQLVARPWQEAMLLRAGYAYEAVTDWHLRRPSLQF